VFVFSAPAKEPAIPRTRERAECGSLLAVRIIPERPKNSALLTTHAPVRQLAAFTVDFVLALFLMGAAMVGIAEVLLIAFDVSLPYGNPIFETVGYIAAVGFYVGFGAARWRLRTPGMRLFRL
jgi:uncharacterized RDD family membrane protein YckC